MRVPQLLAVAVLVAAAVCVAADRGPRAAPASGELRLRTPDAALQTAFDWARSQALQYVGSGGDAVGDWYEAALPGREAFCMRDVAHQAMGAYALGLHRQNRNMLFRFAENISASKDWCSYWEINRHNVPAPVDYSSDDDFWYNLPANFDVLDACFRMYSWSGDRTFLDTPAFVNFYEKTMTDYIERWGLGPDQILRRQRIMNQRPSVSAKPRFARSRGIPGYDEQQPEFVCGCDLAAAQYAAYQSWSRILLLRGDRTRAEQFAALAERARAALNNAWWDKEQNRFHSFAMPEGRFLPGGLNLSILYFGAVDSDHDHQTVEAAVQQLRTAPPGIEAQSHAPEVLYRYGRAEAAYAQLLDLSRPDKPRREYPEVSFAVIGAIVNGLMGIEPDRTRVGGGAWTPDLDGSLMTLPRLTVDTPWVELSNLPFRGNRIAVRHDDRGTMLTNESGPDLRWHACLPVSNARLQIKGKGVVRHAMAARTQGFTCADVLVASGGQVRVSARR